MEEIIVKEKYTAPEMEIIKFDSEDVITASLTDGGIVDDFGKSKTDIIIP